MNTLQTNGRNCPAATLDSRSSSIPGQATGLLSGVLGVLATWHERWQQRRQLAQLDPRLLRDIGLDGYEATREIRKPFWSE